jgi:hypothetical protein
MLLIPAGVKPRAPGLPVAGVGCKLGLMKALPLGLLAVLAALAGSVSAAEPPLDAELIPVKAGSFDKAWQRPDANLSGYNGVLIRPVAVSFSKDWRARDYGPNGLKATEVERIRATHAEIAHDAFARVLSQGGYRVVDAPGAGVLEVQVEVADLYVNAPADDSDIFIRTYVRSFGDMRLLITLRDSVSGTTLFHSSDRKRGDETGRLEWANSVYNRSEAQRALADGARQLKKVLLSR